MGSAMWFRSSGFQLASNSVYSLAVGITHQKRRRNSAADAAHRAIAMDFAVARVHHSEVTLAVHDFPRQLYLAQVDGSGRQIALPTGTERAGLQFDHVILTAKDALPLELNLTAIQLTEVADAVLSWPNEQPRQSLAGNHKRGVWPGQQGSAKLTILLEFEGAGREGMLAGNEDRSRRDGHGSQPGKHTADVFFRPRGMGR